MSDEVLSVVTKLKVGFYDVDSMSVVWHGNYVKFLERGRCALLDKVGYNYYTMEDEGFVFPVVEMKLKYIRPLVFNEEITVRSAIVEYENRLKIKYEIRNQKGELATKAETVQMVVNAKTNETLFECPPLFTERVRRAAALQAAGTPEENGK